MQLYGEFVPRRDSYCLQCHCKHHKNVFVDKMYVILLFQSSLRIQFRTTRYLFQAHQRAGSSLSLRLCQMGLRTYFQLKVYQMLSHRIRVQKVCFLQAEVSYRIISMLSTVRFPVSTPSNPCHCTNSWNCQCRAADNASSLNLPSSSVTEASSARRRNGLVTLAQAAAFCCNQELPLASDPLNHPPTTTCVVSSQVAHSASTVEVEQSNERRKHRRYHDGLSSDPYFPPQPKRHKLSLPFTCEHESHALQTTRGPDLPPILYPYSNSLTSASEGASPSPTFPDIPPLSTIASLAGSGCCCGLQCSCPGCVEHRGAEHVSEDFNDCDDGCGTCVDNDGGIELPSAGPAFSSGESSSSSTSRFIDAFLARAASLPLPPRTRTAALDATNVTVYPSTLFLGAMKEREERGVAFGLVSLPPLECGCSGGCGCPEGRCECGDECGGCCASEIDSRDSETVGISMSAPTI